MTRITTIRGSDVVVGTVLEFLGKPYTVTGFRVLVAPADWPHHGRIAESGGGFGAFAIAIDDDEQVRVFAAEEN